MKDKLKYIANEFFAACWEVIKLPFWMIKVGWKKLLSFGPRRIGLVLGATIIVTAVALTGFVEVTSQPDFCKSCHVMKPYYEAWETSSHNQISCTECHIQPGLKGTVHAKFMALSMVANYFTGVYKRSKPWAEIEDAACLRDGCHETRLLAGTVDFKGVKFDHRPHLEQPRRDRQLRCTSCHAQIVQGEHITVTGSTCFLCHFKPDSTGKWSDLARCTHCHNPPQGAAAADTSFDHSDILARKVECVSCHATEISGDGFVPIDRCNSCHAQKEHAERYNDRDFVHKMHVTEHKVECTSCHIAIRHGKDAVTEENRDRQCSNCHGGPDNAIEAVWQGTLPGLPVAPSSMARAGMSCSSCHIGDVHGKVEKVEPTCLPCHDESFSRLWPRWNEPLLKSLSELESKARNLSGSRRDSLLKAIRIYREGNPVHNPDLIRSISAEITGSVAAVSVAQPGNCNECHPAAGSAVVMRGARRFDHTIHTRETKGCTDCHEVESARHGTLKMSDATCNNCHHKTDNIASLMCEQCHATQSDVYQGRIKGGSNEQSVMASAVSCAECHADGNKIVRDPTGACVSCHDAAYADTLKAWKNSGIEFDREVRKLLATANRGNENYSQYNSWAELYRRDGSSSAHNPNLFKMWLGRLQTTP